jgi:16S rRNA (guanine527-N7)-methyltransferase
VSDALDALLDALASPHAPTTVRSRAEARDVHIADSLAGLPYVRGRVADLGSGAGIPALVLAAAEPSLSVVAVESVSRKARFIEQTAERMGLRNVEVVALRAEEWTAGRDACDTVTARALAALPVICEYAAPLLRVGGRLVCWKGAVDSAEEADGRAAARTLGLSEPEVVAVTPFPGSQRRTLWLWSKVSETPPRFPRRPGIATKRPLSAKTQ